MKTLDEIQRQGANSFAIGLNKSGRNPYYLIENMPASTGETIDDWAKKANAWQMGWAMERLKRTGTL